MKVEKEYTNKRIAEIHIIRIATKYARIINKHEMCNAA